MKLIAPGYYRDFECIKGDCRHSCCVGWEIDIDAGSLERYQGISGTLGEKLQANIVRSEEGAHFRLGENERCPFLNADGLCELIIEKGDGILCQICADHPRFRNFFSDREEIGLGLCCEAAARLILEYPDKVRCEVVDDDGKDEDLWDDEAILLELRDELTSLMQNRRIPTIARVERILELTQIEMKADLRHWSGFLSSLERLDDAWAVCLDQPSNYVPEEKPVSAAFELASEQLMIYLLYRHLPSALDDDDLSGRIAYCVLIWSLLYNLWSMENAGSEQRAELARLYSSEIEYSDENIAAILDELHRVYPEI